MTRRDWLLLLFALKGAPQGLDPVRIQKCMFLFAQEGGVDPGESYSFRPYHYGPMSPEIYGDLEHLESAGLINGESVPGYSWKRYRATRAGIEAAREFRNQADTKAIKKLHQIKVGLSQKTFSTLLRDIYSEYPEYATRSVFGK